MMRHSSGGGSLSTIVPVPLVLNAGAFGSFPPLRWTEAILFPGFDGGFEWGGSAADPDGVLYANLNEMPWIYQLVPTRRDGAVVANPEKQYLIHCGPCHRPDQAGDPANGLPSLVGLPSRKTRDDVAKLIAQGAGRMPPMSAVPTRKPTKTAATEPVRARPSPNRSSARRAAT